MQSIKLRHNLDQGDTFQVAAENVTWSLNAQTVNNLVRKKPENLDP